MFDPIQPFLKLVRLVGWIWIITTLRVGHKPGKNPVSSRLCSFQQARCVCY